MQAIGLHQIEQPATGVNRWLNYNSVTQRLEWNELNTSNWDAAYTYSQVKHLPLTGGTLSGLLTLNTDVIHNSSTNTKHFYFTRTGSTVREYMRVGLDDNFAYFDYNNDEYLGNIRFQINNTDTESGGGAQANTSTLTFSSNNAGAYLTIKYKSGAENTFWHTGNFTNNSTNWNTAYGWGDYRQFGLGITTDTAQSDLNAVTYSGLYSITTTTLNQPAGLSAQRGGVLQIARSGVPNKFQLVVDNAGNVFARGYTDPTWSTWRKMLHDGNFTDNSTNWDTAFGWGNHASAGYLKEHGRLSGQDVNTWLESGVRGTSNNNTNTPGGYEAVLSARNVDTGWQIAGGYSTNALRYRGWYNSGTTWTPWRNIWSDGSMGSQPGRDNTTIDLNDYLADGGTVCSYGAAGFVWNNSPILYGIIQTIKGSSANMYAQIGYDIRHGSTDFGDMHYRTKNSTGWATWRKIWHSGNLLQANASTSGWLSSTDWNTFNSKLSTSGKAADSTLLDGMASNRFWFGDNSRKSRDFDAIPMNNWVESGVFRPSATDPSLPGGNHSGIFHMQHPASDSFALQMVWPYTTGTTPELYIRRKNMTWDSDWTKIWTDKNLKQANASTSGWLSSTDWNTFNNKQAAGSYFNLLSQNTVSTQTTFTVSQLINTAYNGLLFQESGTQRLHITATGQMILGDNLNVGLVNASNTNWFRPQDSSGNMHLKVTDVAKGIYHDAKTHYFRDNAGGSANNTDVQVYGSLNADRIGVRNVLSNTGLGLSLYGGPSAGKPVYGIMFAGTVTFGTHGSVTSDWATYFTMNDQANRGWIFQRGAVNVASISTEGNMALSGDLLFATGARKITLNQTIIRDNGSGATVIGQNGATPAIYLRPAGDGSTTNELYLSATAFTVGGNAVWHAGNLAFGSGATNMAAGNHNHDTTYVPRTYLSSQNLSDGNAPAAYGVNFNYFIGTNKPPGTDHALMTMRHSANWSVQLAGDWRTNEWYVRTQNNGTWGATWAKLWHSGNLTPGDYALASHAHNTISSQDVRAAHPTPDALPAYTVSAHFHQGFGIESKWMTALTVNGWSTSYTAWQLIGPSDLGTPAQELYLRTGNGASWNTAHKIWHSGNSNLSTVDFSARNLNLTGKAVIEATNNDDPAIIELNTRFSAENWRARIISDYYGGKYAAAVQHGMSFIGGRAGFENFRWFTNALVEHMTLSKDGNLTVKGNVTSNSDARLKTNVRDYEDGLEKTLRLRPVVYDRVDTGAVNEPGFIAQEVREVEPELVLEGDDPQKTLSIDYARMVTMLTAALQRQQAQIDALVQKLKQT